MALLAQPMLSLLWRKPALRRGAILCVTLALLGAAAEIVVALSLLPIMVSIGVDAGDGLSGFISEVTPVSALIIFGVAAALRALFGWLATVQEQKTTQALVVALQTRLYTALAGAHWDAVRHLSPPKITSALQSQAYEASYGFSYFVQVASAALLVIGYLISSAIVFPLVVPALLAVMFVMWLLNLRRNRQVNEHSEQYVGAYTELHQRYEDWVSISRIASLGVNTDKLAGKFAEGASMAASHAVAYSRSSAATAVSYDIARGAAIIIGVPVAWWLDAPPALLAFALVALVRVLPRASAIQTGYQGIVNAVAPLQAVTRLTDELEKDQVLIAPAGPSLEWQSLELTELGLEDTARENGRRWILRDISLALRSGEWLALTGPTGSGKTTLAEVMLMLVRPDAGQLAVDGQRVDEQLASRWRNQVAYVPQDVVLLDASIRDNLRLYAPDATDEQLLGVLDQAAAGFVSASLPEGLDTRAGPGGRWLSGGERQRLGIARALLRKPAFLVLDEPTAALDSDTQHELMESLARLKRDMTLVVITHRSELENLTDRVIRLENGAIQYSDQD